MSLDNLEAKVRHLGDDLDTLFNRVYDLASSVETLAENLAQISNKLVELQNQVNRMRSFSDPIGWPLGARRNKINGEKSSIMVPKWHDTRTAETLTNIVIFLAGVVALAFDANAWAFTLAMTYLAVGSALWHWTHKDYGADHDLAGMYATLGVLCGYALGYTAYNALILGAICAIGLRWGIITKGLKQPHRESSMAAKLAVLLLAYMFSTHITISEFLHINNVEININAAFLGVGSLGVAYFIRQNLSKWGHAVWHIAAAFALLLMYQIAAISGYWHFSAIVLY